MHVYSKHTSGFSTLMALGTIGILLIIVIGLATLYINEMRLSRISYDEIVAYANAEGAFEYGMLKVRNHGDGFEDRMTPTEPDGNILSLSSDRSKNMKTSYSIESASTGETFPLSRNEHLIIPLFASDEGIIPGGSTSKKPQKNSSVKKVNNLKVTGLSNIIWVIMAMRGSESIGLTGIGDINSSTLGSIRERGADCYDISGTKLSDCLHGYAEILDYFYDTPDTIGTFLSSGSITSPYLMIYNTEIGPKNIRIESDPSTPFSLPEIKIEASAQKNNSLQVFRFTEDKSKYYEALKYGIFNKDF